MIKVKITKNIIRKNTVFMGLSWKQIITACATVLVGIATFFSLNGVVEINLLMSIIFIEMLVLVFFVLIRKQGMSLARFILIGLKGVDKRPYDKKGVIGNEKRH